MQRRKALTNGWKGKIRRKALTNRWQDKIRRIKRWSTAHLDKQTKCNPVEGHTLLYRSFTPPTGVKHLGDNLVHTSPGNCITAFNSSTHVKHLFSQLLTQKELTSLLWLYKPQSFWSKIIQILSLSKSRTEEIPLIGMKNVCSFNQLI